MHNACNRFGWITLDTEENMLNALKKCQTLQVQNYHLAIVRSQQPRKQVRVFPKIDREKALEVTRKLIEVMDQEKGIADNPLTAGEGDAVEQEKRLDLHLLYLRRVHAYCYLSAMHYPEERMLVSKCGV